VRKFWQNLNPRERSYVIILGVFVVFLGFFFAGRSFLRYMNDISERSESAERDTIKIENLGREYQLLQATKSSDSQQIDGMLPAIEAMLKAIGLREKVGTLTYTDTPVQEKYIKREVKVSIRESSATQVMDFVRQIEQSTQTLYRIDNFTFRPVLKKPGIYDFNMQISGFQKK